MALSAAVSPNKQRIVEGRFVADLAALLQRSGVVTAAGWDPQLFESLLRSGDSFRSRLFPLCTAISHMSEQDLSEDELIHLLAQALGITPGETIPAHLRSLFLEGLDSWNNRLAQQDEWPPARKPPASVSIVPADPAIPPPPRGRTVQEAIELARTRGLHRHDDLNDLAADADVDAGTIHELNALLGEIENRMKRLRPHIVPTQPGPGELLTPDAREAAFLERHAYLQPKRPTPLVSQLAIALPPAAPEPELLLPALPPPALLTKSAAAPPAEAEPELHLLPRSTVVEADDVPGGLSVTVPDALRFKTYLALALVICVALVGTPISVVVAYRYMHPLYIYPPAPPKPDTSAEAAQPSEKANVPAVKTSPTARRSRPSRPKSVPAVQLFPAQ